MIKGDFVAFEAVKSERGYIIKDESNMDIGKIQIVEYSKENRNCTFRLCIYKNDSEYIRDIIKSFIEMLFMNEDLYKINILVKEDIELQPFFDLNFHIEGVLTNNTMDASKYYNEILFGIDYDIYTNLKTISLLRLDGKNINLRILTANDANKLLNYYKDNKKHLENFEELRDETFYTIEKQKLIIRQQYVQLLNGNNIFFGIFKDENIIGIIQLYNIVWGIFKSATIGYSIDEKQQGKGYMKEAVNLILKYAFQTLKLHRVQAGTLVDNLKSKSVLKACGFKEIGISEKYLFINGSWQDHCIFYKLNMDL
jgi:ribosomal-protein-alanine N-acetyltransferase